VDDPYEPPLNAELVIKNQEMTVQESVDIILKALQKEGVLVGGPTLKNGLPYPDGDEMIELHIPPSKVKERLEEAQKLPKALLTDIDVNWLQVYPPAPYLCFFSSSTLSTDHRRRLGSSSQRLHARRRSSPSHALQLHARRSTQLNRHEGDLFQTD
jgi:hypothetical protein